MSPNSPGRPVALSREDVLSMFDKTDLPFITASMVADRADVSIATARNRLDSLDKDNKVEEYELDARRKLYFRPNFETAADLVETIRRHLDVSGIDVDDLEAFAKNPYKILPKGEGDYYVVVPKFIPFHVGHLHEQNEAWQVFVVNKYISWIEDIPDEIREKVDISQRFKKAVVNGNILELSDQEEREEAWDAFDGRDGGLHRRVDENKIQIQNGQEFEVIAKLIEEGNLPFKATSVSDADLRGEPEDVSLRSYQENAWKKFLEYGKVGIYWPPGTGKTFIALYAGERIHGKKLVVVPTSTLEQQWEERIEKFCARPEDWEVRTYQYLTYGDNLHEYTSEDAPALFIADECHRLPADTFSTLATIDSSYRLGLSASPYREDERTDYIFALTGVPVGIDWQQLVELGVVDYPTVWVYLYQNERQKKYDVLRLAQQKTGRGIIFCDSLDAGQEVADDLGVPFVSGDTAKQERRRLVQENRVTVVSRVGDEGLSIDDLDWSIEYQFHGGSRRQEIQRTGRVMHTEEDDSLHIIQMTDSELDRFGERLYGLEERGIELQFERRSPRSD